MSKVLDSGDNRYRLVKMIASGGFGEVWRGEDLREKRTVAVKLFHLEKAGKGYLDLFKREFELLSELGHSHVARVYDFGFLPKQERYFFTSEFCEGKSLLEAIEGKPVSYFEECLVQILSALDYIHSQGIIHFDIKPENIIVEDQKGQPNVKLVDFGVAVKLKALPTGWAAGTLPYIAPEILRKSPHLDSRVDLYSLGMVCVRCLTDQFPFDRQSAEEVVEWHLRGSLDPSIWEGHDVPRYLQEIAVKLLKKNPSDRFSNARVVLNFLNLATDRRYQAAEKLLQGQIPAQGPLVEREKIIENLKDQINKIFSKENASDASVVTLCGEQGMGKSRILEEIRHAVELKEIPVFDFTCDWQVPLWPRLAEQLQLDEKRSNRTGSVELLSPSEELGTEWQTRKRADSLIEAAKKNPFCLLIDDYHKVDQDTRLVMDRFREHKGIMEGRFLIVMAREGDHEKPNDIQLTRISPVGIKHYTELVLGPSDQTETVANLLSQYSGGLPLLMVEGMRFLAPHFYRGESLENLLPPPQLASLYEERLKLLSPPEKEALQILSLLFRASREEELVTILGDVSEQRVLWRTCLREGLVRGGVDGFQISSQALALGVIQSMDPETRKRLHAQIAAGLQKLPQIPMEEVAYHLAKGGHEAEASHHYEQAARVLENQGRISSAVRCLMKVAELSPSQDEAWTDIIYRVAKLLIMSGAYQEAEPYLQKLEKHPSGRLYELKGWLAFKKRQFIEAKKSYRQALKFLTPNDRLQRILIQNAQANVDLHAGNLEEASSLFHETLELENRLSREDRLKIVNNNLGLVLSLQGDVTGAASFFQDRLKNLPPDRIPEKIQLLNGLGYVLVQGSLYDEAVVHLKEALELAERSGTLQHLFSIMGNLVSAYLKSSHYADCLPLMKKVVAYQERLGTPRDTSFNLLRLSSTYLILGMEEAARDGIRRGRELAEEIGDDILIAWNDLMEGYREREFGSYERAVEYFEETEDRALQVHNDDLIHWARYSLADVAYEADDLEECERQLSRIANRSRDEEFQARVDLLKGKTMIARTEIPSLDLVFSSLEGRCLKNHFQEILWEVYHAWGLSEWLRGHKDKARDFLEKGVEVSNTLADALPEEYRDRYLKQTARKKLYADWERAKDIK